MNSDADKTNYDNISDAYISHIERADSWNNVYERPNLIAKLADGEDRDFQGKTVLDLGCGTGYYTNYALEHRAMVTAIDASRKMLDYVEKKYSSPNLTCISADIAKGVPELADESQDCIVCSLVLHYIERTDFLFDDMYRILKPGGKFYISTHHPFSDHLFLKKDSYFDSYLVEDTWGVSKNPFNVYYYTKPLTEIMSPITKSKFEIVEIDEPLPDENCKDTAPSSYRKLLAKPGFLFLTLKKN